MGLEARLLLGHCSPRLSALSGPSRIGPTDHFEGIRASHIKGQTLVEMAGTHQRSHIMENVTLTPKEQSRLQVLNSLAAEHMTLDQAAELMGVTSRHTRRILAAYRERGAAALAHGHRGRQPVNATPEALVVDLAHLARTRYAGINHTHLAELLAEAVASRRDPPDRGPVRKLEYLSSARPLGTDRNASTSSGWAGTTRERPPCLPSP